ncbi:hypothetical protein TRFO_13191 [Tritrichomonas foetus]|uniref:Uncharacterized protein n=1 Tax=Tritrichomonas foetus TaxID=1144522 RepID=A0A1J4KYN1_9EUKA|nr:hypothetical protein TRFO_13191 [Tritrichomonas foetus]|eukprot:OHT16359.1 hypothetical protein TRFO_13191 [Tritrichomonas foetus]
MEPQIELSIALSFIKLTEKNLSDFALYENAAELNSYEKTTKKQLFKDLEKYIKYLLEDYEEVCREIESLRKDQGRTYLERLASLNKNKNEYREDYKELVRKYDLLNEQYKSVFNEKIYLEKEIHNCSPLCKNIDIENQKQKLFETLNRNQLLEIKNNELIEENERLRNDLIYLDKNIKKLYKENDKLRHDILAGGLEQENKKIKVEFKKVLDENLILEKEYNEMIEENDRLRKELATFIEGGNNNDPKLVEEYDELLNDYNTLAQSYNELQANFAEVNNRLEQLNTSVVIWNQKHKFIT